MMSGHPLTLTRIPTIGLTMGLSLKSGASTEASSMRTSSEMCSKKEEQLIQARSIRSSMSSTLSINLESMFKEKA